jgi:hypothetical protein
MSPLHRPASSCAECRRDYNSFVGFEDPDGNAWLV